MPPQRSKGSSGTATVVSSITYACVARCDHGVRIVDELTQTTMKESDASIATIESTTTMVLVHFPQRPRDDIRMLNAKAAKLTIFPHSPIAH